MNFDMKTFYGWAVILMIISFLGNLGNTILTWDYMNIFSRISNIAGSVLFNALLLLLFYWLWTITPSQNSAAKIIDNPDLDALIKKYSEGGENVKEKKNSRRGRR